MRCDVKCADGSRRGRERQGGGCDGKDQGRTLWEMPFEVVGEVK